MCCLRQATKNRGWHDLKVQKICGNGIKSGTLKVLRAAHTLPNGMSDMKQNMKMQKLPALLLGVTMTTAGTAAAAGFQAWEQSASGLGVAYAGSAAVANDASTVFYNPAGMANLPGVHFSTGVVGVNEQREFRGAGGRSGGEAGEPYVIPNAYMSWQITPQLTAGLGVSRPYMLDLDYKAGWQGDATVRRTEIRTVNFNPALAYKLSDKVALGLGLNYQQLDWRLTSATSNTKADDSAVGWNVGALFTLSPAMRVGVAYRSKIEHDLSGRQNGAAFKGDLDTPASLTLSVWQQVSDRWEAMGDLSYTHWKSIDGYDLDNAWRFAWGAAYKFNPRGKIKFGIAYDHAPMGKHKRIAALPDNDRLWFSLGGQWTFGKASVLDVGYAYQYLRDGKVADGAVVGRYEGSGHVLGVQYAIGF